LFLHRASVAVSRWKKLPCYFYYTGSPSFEIILQHHRLSTGTSRTVKQNMSTALIKCDFTVESILQMAKYSEQYFSNVKHCHESIIKIQIKILF